ncbi:MAG: DNA methylase [Bacillota bacterium]|nr:DNA methylase [Bacillota bacterium]
MTGSNKLIAADQHIISELEKLPMDYWDFKNEDTRELTHGIHTYPAVMVYPISRNLIRIIKQYQDIKTLMDPFMGSGTVLVEGVLSGMEKVYGTDLNPLARLISSVKTKHLHYDEIKQAVEALIIELNSQYANYDQLINSVDDFIRNEKKLDITAKDGWGSNAPDYLKEFFENKNIQFDIPDFKNIGYWFLPKVIIELQIIKICINKINDENIKNFIRVAFSETVRLVSNRRNSEFKMFRIALEKLPKYNPDTKSEFIKILTRNIEKMKSFYDLCDKKEKDTEVFIYDEDTRYLTNIPDNSIDLMVTSPPYGDSRTTVAYGEFSRVSLQWLDLYEVSNKSIMDIDKNLMGGTKFKKGFENSLQSPTLKAALGRISEIDQERAGDVYSFYKDLDECIKSITQKMKINSYQFWVVGNRTVKLENLKTNEIIEELGQQYGLEAVYTIGRNIPNKVMPSQNSPSNVTGEKVTTMTNEHIVILRKVR